MIYEVRYQFATYSGKRVVNAEDQEHAVALVRQWCRKQSSLPMAYEHYDARPACNDGGYNE